MKPMISKALVCGILASSFIIINCQKAPSRGVKADTGNPNGKVTAAVLPNCSEAAVTAIDARSALLKEIKDIVAAQSEAQATALNDDQKVELHDKTNLLNEKTSDAVQKIRASGANGAPAEGCKKVDPRDDKNSKDVKVAELTAEDRELAAQVSAITGQSNDILDRAARMLAVGKEISIKADLADMLSSEANYNGNKGISAGQILSKEQYDALKNDNSKTSCIIKSADRAAVAADSKAKIMDISTPKAEGQRMMVDVAMEIKNESESSRPVAFTCALAQNKDAAEEITNAFGDLVSTAPAAAPTPGGDAPAPGEEQPASPQVQEAEALSALVQRLNQGQ